MVSIFTSVRALSLSRIPYSQKFLAPVLLCYWCHAPDAIIADALPGGVLVTVVSYQVAICALRSLEEERRLPRMGCYGEEDML